MAGRMREWEVVGGADKGGILVREGAQLSSAPLPDRLSTGALVAELALFGERLHYHLISGEGPRDGWVSIQLGNKQLMRLKTDGNAAKNPGAPKGVTKQPAAPKSSRMDSDFVPVDEMLKKQIQTEAG